MNEQLRAELELRGWHEVFGERMEFTSPVNSRGEVRARSPWPDCADHRASFSLNTNNGLFRCFKTQRAGNYVHFLAWMDATEVDDRGELLPLDLNEVERQLLQDYQIVNPVNPDWIEQCRQALQEDPAAWQMLEVAGKSWNPQVCYDLGVGYDAEKRRIVFPCYDRMGALINARMYGPGQNIKMFWVVRDMGGNFLWPSIARDEPVIILTEGEGDALTLRSVGFAAASGTLGSGQPVPDGWWFRRKHIFLCFDIDAEGRAAEQRAIERMVRDAASIRVMALPQWPGRSDKADVSDYVSHLRAGGCSTEEIQRAIQELMATARTLPPVDAVLDAAPVEVEFLEAQDPEFHGRRIRFRAQVVATAQDGNYRLSTRVLCECPAEGHSYCDRCPMREEIGPLHHYDHRPSRIESLRMFNVPDRDRTAAVKELLGVPVNCPDFKTTPEEVVNIQSVMLTAPIGTEYTDLTKYEAHFIMPDDDTRLEATREYILTGFCYPHPKTQKAVYLVDTLEEAETTVEQFRMTETIREELAQFQPRTGQSVWDKLSDVAQDYIDAVTGIRGRLDLHLAYRSVWHSVLRFNLGNEEVDRGWIECLVMGDTACGKSQAFKQMCEWLAFGRLVDCKNQSVAGILGATVQDSNGNWFVSPGVYPQNDGRLLGFDEFSTKLDKGSVIEHLSSARSEGWATINKAAAGRFRCRVRTVWMANPGQGRLLKEIAATGVELIPRLIRQPEDIRRFDFAVIVAQEDVPSETIQESRGLSAARYSQRASRDLLLWAWSRKPEHVEFTDDALLVVQQLAKIMVDRYTDRVPIVERSEQRKRIAKLAVSIAAQCFSTDEDGEKIIVRYEHVEAASQLYVMWYDKAAMGYDLYSSRVVSENCIHNPSALELFFNEQIKPNGSEAARQLLKLREFQDRMLTNLILPSPLMQGPMMATFIGCRLIQPVDGGRRNTYEVTPAGVLWLKQYLGI